MRIALLNPVFWPEVRRGSERFARDLADHLIAEGHSVRLLTSHPGRTSRTVEDGLEVIRSWRPPDGRLRRRLYEDHLTHLPLTFRELMRGDDDIVHALYPTDAVAAVEWRRRTGRPVVHSYMGIPHRRSIANRRLRVEVLQRAIAGSSATVALSDAAAAGFREWLGVEARVIRPGVDLDAFSPGGQRESAPTIFCPADASQPRKRVNLLIEAMELVRNELPDARLVLGTPNAGSAGAAGAPAGVEHADVDDIADLVAALRSAWVTCLPSEGEAFGLVLLESLACGTPVVGTDEGGIPEVLGDDPRVGSLFSGGADALAEALLSVIRTATDPTVGESCRARAEELPTQRTGRKYVNLYEELLGA